MRSTGWKTNSKSLPRSLSCYVIVAFPGVHPKNVPLAWESEIVVEGTGFSPSALLSCVFRLEIVADNQSLASSTTTDQDLTAWTTEARLLSTEAVACTTTPPDEVAASLTAASSPEVMGESQVLSVQVSVSNNGLETDGSWAELILSDAPILESATPTAGPTSGCTMITILGHGFLNSSELSCSFSTITTPGVFVDSGEVHCRSPALWELEDHLVDNGGDAPTTVALRVSNNGVSVSERELAFMYAPQPTISAVYPRVVSTEDVASDGAFVSISGTGFVQYFEEPGVGDENPVNSLVATNTTCRFSGIGDSLAVLDRLTMITCQLPAASNAAAGVVAVSVSVNGQDFPASDSGMTLTLTMAPRVGSIFPESGPSSGGTTLQVFGDNFAGDLDPLLCTFQFGGVETALMSVAAEYDGRGFVRCNTPPVPTMAEVTSSTANAADGGIVSAVVRVVVESTVTTSPMNISSTGSDAAFSTAMEFVYFATPTVSDVAPKTGASGTLVDVTGAGFLDAAGLTCRFGNTTVAPLEFKSNNVVTCKAPRQENGEAIVAVEVSNNLVDWTSNGVSFIYRPRATVDSVTPKVGPVNGSTIVRVAGSNFFASTGSDGVAMGTVSCRFGSMLVPATAVTVGGLGEIFCVSPAVDSPGSVSLEIAEDGLDVTNSGWRFDYVPDVHVTEAFPLTGPEGGGTAVTIIGPGFLGSETAVCQFGAAGFRVTGRWVSRTTFVCDSPSQRPGIVPLAISTNGQQFVDVGLAFSYQPQETVRSVSPRSGSVHGGTQVSVTGAGFVNSTDVACRFGEKVGEAEYVDSALVLCRAPATEPTTQNGGRTSVSISIANNGFDFATSENLDAMFEYVPSFELLSIEPMGGPTTGGTILRVDGVGFSTAGTINCVVDGLVVETIAESAEILACVTPPTADAGLVDVRLTNNGVEMSSTSASFHYHSPIGVATVYPTFVPESGGSRLLVTGSGFLDMGALACVFSFPTSIPRRPQIESMATYISGTLLSCASPEGGGVGPADLHVTNNGVDVSVSSVPFSVTSTSTVTKLWPSSGSTDGGTSVRVQGTGFLDSTTAFCRFGDYDIVSVDTVLDSTSVLCTSPSRDDSDTSQVTVEVTSNGLDWTSSGVLFTYLPPLEVFGVSPNIGPLSGGTVVRVTGAGFEDVTSGGGKLSCRFGGSVVSATVTGADGVALCVAPPSQRLGAVPLEVSSNDIEFSSDGWTFHYGPDISVESAWPLVGPESGGTVVTVKGAGFTDTRTILCEFGSLGALVLGKWMDSSTLSCVSPTHMPGTTALRLSMNGQQFVETALSFEYLIESTVRAISPSSGPLHGGTIVEVEGTGFANSTALSCHLAGRRLPAVFVDSGRIRCTTPPLAAVSQLLSLPLEVSNNGIDFTNRSTAIFSFVPALIIRHLWPTSGPVDGGSSVSVYGSSFSNGGSRILCIFGGDGAQATVATVLSDDELSCLAPPYGGSSTGGAVSVELTNNGGADRVASPTNFTYVKSIQLTSVNPSQSGEEGGVVVIVAGENFVSSPSLSCSFGGQGATPATFMSPTRVSCLVPESPAGPRDVSLTVSNNGQDFAGGSSLVFSYLPAFTILKIEPGVGPVDGGTEVTLTGTGLSETGPWACVFGEILATSATQLTNGQLRCNSPPQPPGRVQLRVFRSLSPLASAVSGAIAAAATNSLRDFGLTFEYQGTVFISSVEPRSGSNLGGTPVTIRGFGFGNASGTIMCGFGEQNGQLFTSPAVLASPGMVVCSSPPRVPQAGEASFSGGNPSVVSVTLSLNGADFTSRGPQYMYYEPIEALGVFPTIGSVEGGTVVTVVGRHFLPSEALSCRFGAFAPSPGEFISSEAIRCSAPPSPDGPTKVDVSVSNNLVEFSDPSTSTTFEYLPRARPERFHPKAGPLSGGTVVAIDGSHFPAATTAQAQLACRFGSITVEATLQSSTRLTCQAPTSIAEKLVSVKVTVNGADWEDVGTAVHGEDPDLFTYYRPPEVTALHPSTGPPIGGTHLSVFGRYLAPVSPEGQVLCRIGNTSTTASQHVSTALSWEESSGLGDGSGEELVTCKVPDLGAGDFTTVEVAVSTDGGVHFSSPPLMFAYLQVRKRVVLNTGGVA